MKTKLITTAALVALLSACGGGGGSDPVASPTPKSDTDITTGATSTATTLDATSLSTVANTLVYDVAADIGDTWRITFNTAAKTYAVTIINTVYGLANTSAGASGTYTSSTSGKLTSYALTGNAGNAGTLAVDDRVKDISGNLTIGGKSSTVAGTSTSVSDLAKLAGTYNFLSAARNATNGQSPDSLGGQIKINADGATAKICVWGTFQGDVCTAVSKAMTNPPESRNLTLRKDTSVAGVTKILLEFADGTYTATEGKNFGVVNIQAGDLGPVLLIDRIGNSTEGTPRTGTFYAVKQQALTGSNFDGTWKCSRFAQSMGSAVFKTTNGSTTATITTPTGAIETDTLTWNTVIDPQETGKPKHAWNGFGVDVAKDGGIYALLPLSSTMFVAETDNETLMTCRKQ